MRVSPLEGHAIWASHYDTEPNPLLALETRTLCRFMEPIPLRRFVDVACGTGRWMSYLYARGCDVLGSDACEPMLKVAEKKRGLQGKCVLADATLLPFARRFADVTLCSFAAGYVSDLSRLVCELAAITRSGGRVIITDLHPLAIAAGWRRSFRIGTTVYDIQHRTHSEEQLFQAGECANLRLDTHLQPSFGEPERELFERAGKGQVFDEVSAIPAVWIGVWRTR
ncbi:MAG TPA: class I SAM-dependent methyltransferase [Bryobacteraceae bacterium]